MVLNRRMKKPREIIAEWDGPVCCEDRFFHDTDDACEYYSCNCDTFPVYLECCSEMVPSVSSHAADWIVEHVDENYRVSDDCQRFSQYIGVRNIQELKTLIDKWVASTGWKHWRPNGKYIDFHKLMCDARR